MFSETDILAMRRATAFDPTGAKVGQVGDVYLDDASGLPAWATVMTGLFGTRAHFVPLDGASVEGRRLVLSVGKDAILGAPRLAEDEHLSAEEEDVLLAHYGVTRPVAQPEASAPEDTGPEETEPEASAPVKALLEAEPQPGAQDETDRDH